MLTTAERVRFGIADAIGLPAQALLKPLMVQAQALQLLKQGHKLARTGAITAAVAAFGTALLLDPGLAIKPEVLARRSLRNTSIVIALCRLCPGASTGFRAGDSEILRSG